MIVGPNITVPKMILRMCKRRLLEMENLKTKIIVKNVRFSYVNVTTPKAMNNGDTAKYSISLLIPKSDTETIEDIKEAIENAKKVGTAKLGGKIPTNLKMPLRDGDIERPDDENYKGHFFMNASSTVKPNIIDKNKAPLANPEELYSGCYGHASIAMYAFNKNGNKGIACGLHNLMKVKDGEPLGGRASAESDFADISVDDKQLTEMLG